MSEAVSMEEAKAAADALVAVSREVFLPDHDVTSELPVGQLRVCGLLYGGQRPMSALSRELGITLSAMTQIADRLERAHLVKRVAEESDRRVRCLKLTDRGDAIMRKREAARIRRVRVVLERLPPETRQEALAVLEMLARASQGAVAREPCVAAAQQGAGP